MDRRTFIGTLTGAVLAAPLAAEAQQPGKVYRVGYIGPRSVATIVSDPAEPFNSFRREMHQRGYVDKAVVPGVSRVAILWNPTNPTNAPQLRETKVAAQALGVQLQLQEVRGPQDFEAFQAATRERAGALITLDDLLIFTHRIQIVALAAKSRLPATYGWSAFAKAGGLMSYGPDFQDMYRQAAVFVDKILKGAKPGDLPVERPTKFELVINLKTAKALGLTIPPSLLQRADQVIE